MLLVHSLCSAWLFNCQVSTPLTHVARQRRSAMNLLRELVRFNSLELLLFVLVSCFGAGKCEQWIDQLVLYSIWSSCLSLFSFQWRIVISQHQRRFQHRPLSPRPQQVLLNVPMLPIAIEHQHLDKEIVHFISLSCGHGIVSFSLFVCASRGFHRLWFLSSCVRGVASFSFYSKKTEETHSQQEFWANCRGNENSSVRWQGTNGKRRSASALSIMSHQRLSSVSARRFSRCLGIREANRKKGNKRMNQYKQRRNQVSVSVSSRPVSSRCERSIQVDCCLRDWLTSDFDAKSSWQKAAIHWSDSLQMFIFESINEFLFFLVVVVVVWKWKDDDGTHVPIIPIDFPEFSSEDRSHVKMWLEWNSVRKANDTPCITFAWLRLKRQRSMINTVYTFLIIE